jgi:sulfatase maturation enzyme AslB (radical SAM superfamily)
MRFEAAELLTTGQCPLSCAYCYIPKVPIMQDVHKDIIKGLEDGSFLDNLEKVAGQNLAHLSFWGTEPALTLGVIETKLDEIQRRFPKVRNMGFSTSMVMPEPIIQFSKKLEGRNIKMDLQVSIDGPEFIIDKNRFPGASKKIPDNVIEFVKAMQGSGVNIEMHWKPTLTIDNIREMSESTELIDVYMNFFRDLEIRIKDVNKDSNIRMWEGGYTPSIAVPGKYTSDDGIAFAEYLKKLHKKGYVSAYSSRLTRIVNFSDELGPKRRMFTCSGGDSNVGVGDRMHICHRTFYLNDERYVDAVLGKKNINNWDISIFNRGMVDILKKWYMPKIDDELKMMNFDYILRGYHDFWQLKMAMVESMTKELALAGQAEKIFLTNKDYLSLFALFMTAAHSCPMESVLNTGSLHLTPVSMIRMFANGAFREIVKTTR